MTPQDLLVNSVTPTVDTVPVNQMWLAVDVTDVLLVLTTLVQKDVVPVTATASAL